MDWIQQIGDQHPWITITISALASGVIGFTFGLISDRALKWLNRPILKLQFDIGDDFQTPTPDIRNGTTYKAYVFRIRVINTKNGTVAKSCRAFLVGIEELSKDKFVRTAYTDSIPLAWSTRQSRNKKGAEFDPIDLPRGIGQYVDVFAIRRGIDQFEPATSITPFRYRGLYKKKGTLRFRIRIAGDNFDPIDGAVDFTWQKKWDRREDKFEYTAVAGPGCVRESD
jgi:hypothetical protein